MPNADKVQFVQEMSEKFRQANSVFVVNFTGLNANQTVELRKEFKRNNVEFRVVKNTLAKLSFEQAGYSEIVNYLDGVNGYLICYNDPTFPVKFTKDKKELKEKFQFKMAIFEGALIPPDKVDMLATLPSRDELLAKLLATLNAPMANLLGVLTANFQNLLGVLESLKEKKSS